MEIDLFRDRIFVLTPKGEVKDLPVGSISLDFAYMIHTDVGNKCIMAKVNGSVVPLDYELKNNDVVEIITRRDASPKLRWLSMVKTSIAKSKIKSYFSTFNKERNVKEGRKLLNAQLERIGKPALDQNYSVLKNYRGNRLTLSERESLVEEVGNGAKLASDIVRKLYPYEDVMNDGDVVRRSKTESRRGKEFVSLSEKFILENQVLVGGESGLPLKIAACCKPKLRDPIVGYVTRGNRITIHQTGCRLLESLDQERIVFADWKGAASDNSEKKYLVGIRIDAVCRVGLMSDITSIISDLGLNIRDVVVNRARNGLSEEYFLVEFDDLNKFDRLFDKLEGVKGMLKVAKSNKFRISKR